MASIVGGRNLKTGTTSLRKQVAGLTVNVLFWEIKGGRGRQKCDDICKPKEGIKEGEGKGKKRIKGFLKG